MVFNAYSCYYDLLYRDKDYAGEADYVDRRIRQIVPDPKTILELGCGTGIHASFLARKGYRVHGIDLSKNMLAQAEERLTTLQPTLAAQIKVAAGDVRSYRTEECFDAVVSLFHVASYQTLNKDISDLMETASFHLRPGGVFLFDFWYGPAVLTERPAIREKIFEDDRIHVTRVAKPELFPNENCVDVIYHITVKEKATERVEEINERHRMRYFFLPEIKWMLADHGFSFMLAEEWMTGQPPSFSTWGVCVSAKK
jgi:SAM-dependent methyltransferase